MSSSFIQSSHNPLPKQGQEGDEVTLRPDKLADFLGQEALLQRLDVLIGAARLREEPLGHCLFHGPPGLGKTTLAYILAKAMGGNLVTTSGPVLEKPGDLAGILTNLKAGDLLFVDEIHRLPRVVEEYLYSAMEDFSLDLVIDSGPSARSVQLKLQPFTLIGATTRLGLLTGPFRSRFAFTGRLDHYPIPVMKQIVMRAARILSIELIEEGGLVIAKRARGTPRIANNLLRWARDFAQMKKRKPIDAKTATEALELLAIDEIGLDENDKRLLEILIDQHNGGPVGLTTLAVAMNEESATIEEVYEPYLIMEGLIKRTPRGRLATENAFRHLNRQIPPQRNL